MSGLDISGFNFYDILRHILPGILLVFLVSYFILPDLGNKLSLSEKLALGVFLGFVVHPFSMYKWVPGSNYIRKSFQKQLRELIPDINDFYIIWDSMMLTVSIEERQYFRRYLALGAFKLDITLVLIVFLLYNIVLLITDLIYSRIDSLTILLLITLFPIIYVLRDDGLNDLKRAFNIWLMLYIKYEKNLKEKLEKIKQNQEIFIKRERIFFNPTDTIKEPIKKILNMIKSKIIRKITSRQDNNKTSF